MYINDRKTLEEVVIRDFNRAFRKRGILRKSEKYINKPMNYVFINRDKNTPSSSFTRMINAYEKFFKEENLPYVMVRYDLETLFSYELFEYLFNWHGPSIFTSRQTTVTDAKIRRILYGVPKDYTKITNVELENIYKALQKDCRIKKSFSISLDNIGKICIGSSFEDMRVLIPRCDRGRIKTRLDSPIPDFLKDKYGSQSTTKRNPRNE